jgi:hypothetical protein
VSDGEVLLLIVKIIAVLLIGGSFLLPALNESGHLKAPKFGRNKSSSFKQFPLHEE